MKEVKDVLFNEALFHKDRARELTKELGEWDTIVAISEARYQALLSVIEQSGLYKEWEAFLKDVFEKRQKFEAIEEENQSTSVMIKKEEKKKEEKQKATIIKIGNEFEIAIVDDNGSLIETGCTYKYRYNARTALRKKGFEYIDTEA